MADSTNSSMNGSTYVICNYEKEQGHMLSLSRLYYPEKQRRNNLLER